MNLADLLEEFNVVIDTAEGLTELRSLILGLAVRGKLVPQDPNDEPASELLKKIEAEKQRLYKEGKIRKPKKNKTIKEDKIPYKIPVGWKWVRLGEISNYGNHDSVSPEDISDDTWVLELADIEKDTSKIVEVETFKNRKSKSNKYRFQKGDVLYGKLRPYLNKVVIAPNDGVCSTEIIPLKCLSELVNKYLLYALKSDDFLDYANSVTYGTKMPRLGTKDGRKALMPLPPVSEQHRIILKIESLFAEVDELEAKLNRQTKLDEKLQLAVNTEVQQAPDAKASRSAWNFITSNFDTLYHTPEAIDNLKNNILNEAVRGRLVSQNLNDEPASELIKKIIEKKDELLDENEIKRYNKRDKIIDDNCDWSIPESWGLIELQDLFKFIDYRGKNPKKSKEGKRLITAKNIRMGHINNEPIEYISEELYVDWMVRGFPKNGDLLFVTEGHTMGYVAQIDLEFEFALAQRTICLQPIYDISATFYFYALMSPKFQRIIIDNKTGSAAGGIRAGRLRLIPVPIPPIEEQHRIVQRIEELFGICDRFKAQLEQRQAVNERLVKGLVQKVLEKSGSTEEESVPAEEISMAAEPKEESLTKQQIAFIQILCIAHALYVLKQKNMLQGEMGLAKYVYLMDRIGGVDTRFKFEQNNFGPYPSNFRKRLFTKSKYFFKSGSKGYEVIDLTNKSDRLFEKESEKSKEVQNVMETLATIFEPYQKNRAHKLELLASVCWLVEKTNQTDFDTIWKELENWETPKRNDVDYKGELFTKEEVEKSLNYIIDNNWDKKLIKT